MKIKHYLYNAFIIEDNDVKIAIDPGLNMWLFKLGSLIPKLEWNSITHVLATHGDPDHYWYTDRVVQVNNASLICGKELMKKEGEKTFIVAPRGKDIQYSTQIKRVYPIEVGKTISVDSVKIEGLKTVHGPLVVRFFFGLMKKVFAVGPGERTGLGSIGFRIIIGAKTLVNLGDSVLQQEWTGLKPDVLMIPIGGRIVNNTMNEDEALEAVRLISPKLVIPCHYNGNFFWKRNVNPADDRYFNKQVENMGIECRIMGYGDEIVF